MYVDSEAALQQLLRRNFVSSASHLVRAVATCKTDECVGGLCLPNFLPNGLAEMTDKLNVHCIRMCTASECAIEENDIYGLMLSFQPC